MHLPQVQAALSVASLWRGRFEQILIERPVLDVRRRADGRIEALEAEQKALVKRVFRLLAHPRFRAAFDFLELRASAAPDVADDLAFWREAQAQAPEQLASRLSPKTLPRGAHDEVDGEPGEAGDDDDRGPRRRPRRRRRKPAGGSPE